MAQKKKKYWMIAVLLLFVIYIFAATQPIPEERILIPRWLSSLDSGYPVSITNDTSPNSSAGMEQFEGDGTGTAYIPFRLGNHFGYIDDSGSFSINRTLQGYLSISDTRWAEYRAKPESIEIRDPQGENLLRIEKGQGYPLFLDNRTFLIADEQNTLSALDDKGNILWTHDFAAPLTCIDAAAGLVLTGSLDGVVDVLNSEGRRIFSFEPGGSRLAVILGCSISRDGSRLGIISGIDDRRFLLLERFGVPESGEYKVSYHEFLEDGFRGAVHISFIDSDNWVVFERQGGLGIHDLGSRTMVKIPLDGKIAALETEGSSGLLFVITSQSKEQKRLVAIDLPGRIIMETPIKSDNIFLTRRGSRLYLGGGSILASFELGRK
ncbi:hypothetical protein FACS189491_04480 [Spirochaetia bacterium]|nr:hypothetical protein FACS189491_04480 [Spirochaetia bacterium]